MALTDSLISFWELEEDAAATRDDSHGSNDLSPTADPPAVAGKVGNANDFEYHSAHRLTCTSNASLQLGDIDFSFCLWFTVEVLEETEHSLFAKADGTDLAYRLAMSNAGILKWTIAASAGLGNLDEGTWGSALAMDGSWHFAIVWYDAAADLGWIQVNNGTPVSFAHAGGAYVETGPFAIAPPPAFAFAHPWDGKIDQFGFWKRVLTSDERTWLYNSENGRSYAEVLAGMAGPTRYNLAR